MSKGKWIVLAVVILFCAGWLVWYFSSTGKATDKEKWIVQEVYTQAMDSAFKVDSALAKEKLSLLQDPVTQGSVTLYNVYYYPTMHTLICTVSEPEQFGGRVAPYLVATDNTGLSGWYSSSLIQDGIMKIAFEDVSPFAEFMYLDLVDKSTLNGAYNPANSNDTRVRIELPFGKLVTASTEKRDSEQSP